MLIPWHRWKMRRRVRRMTKTGEYSTGPVFARCKAESWPKWTRKQRREIRRMRKHPERYRILEESCFPIITATVAPPYLTINEARAKYGLPPREDGNVPC